MTSLVLALAVVATDEVPAADPDPRLSDIPNVIAVPGGGLTYRVILRDAAGQPCGSASVDLVWPGSAPEICPCPGSPIPLISAVTDSLGVATFNIAAGGCLEPGGPSGGVEVRVGGALLTTVGQVSPDPVDNSGQPVSDCQAGLADAVTLSNPLRDASYGFCADLNSDGIVSLADGVLLSPFIHSAAHCP